MIKRKARIPHLCHEIPRTGDRRPAGRSLFHRLRGREAPAPVSPGADSAVLLSLFCSSCPFRALLMGGAFPGAAPRVPHGLPRAIPGRPFRAAEMGNILRAARGYSRSPLWGCKVGAQYCRIRDCPFASPCRGSPPWLPIRFKRGHVVTPQVNRVPKGRKRIAPGFNPGNNAAPRSSPVGTTESVPFRRCIRVHIRSRAV